MVQSPSVRGRPTRFLGVRRRPSPPARFPWCARIELAADRVEHVSSFATARQAAEAYDRAVLHYFGATAPRNFSGKRLPAADAGTLRAELRRSARATKSKYFGVARRGGRWRVAISIDGRPVFLGNWETERAAGEAYDRAVRFFDVDESRLNFPRRRLTASSPADFGSLLTLSSRRRPAAGIGASSTGQQARAGPGSRSWEGSARRSACISARGSPKRTRRGRTTVRRASTLVLGPSRTSRVPGSSPRMPRR